MGDKTLPQIFQKLTPKITRVETKTYSLYTKYCAQELKLIGVKNYKQEAKWLIEGITKLKESRTKELIILKNMVVKINFALKQRTKGIPLAYILKEQNFYGYNFYVNQHTLIPRMDSEILVYTAINSAIQQKTPITIIDICCGTGCLGITTCKELDLFICRKLILNDISGEALKVARKNAKMLLKDQNIKLLKHNCLNEDFNKTLLKLIPQDRSENTIIFLANPPYIPTKQIKKLDKSVQCEPQLALDGGKDGLIFYHHLAKTIATLKQNGIKVNAFLEIGRDQSKDVLNIFNAQNLKSSIIKDLSHKERVVCIKN